MSHARHQSPRDRLGAAAVAVAIQAALLYALIVGLGVTMPRAIDRSLALFDATSLPPAPPPPTVRSPKRDPRKSGAAAPANLRSRATELTAPPPIVPPIILTPLPVARIAATGNQATSGAAPVPGPGTGSGGIGNGTGSGGSGDGDGAGDGDESPPEQVRGELKDSDYPRDAGAAGVQGTVAVRYLVGTGGRVTDCRVTRSSGSIALDATTCRLIEKRFRFRPSRDRYGRPVPAWIVENHSWIVRDDPLSDGR